jgi:hypothetical protein
MVALRRARPYGGLSQVRPYRGLRPRLACGSWIARFQQSAKNLSKNIGRKGESQVKRIYNEDYKKIKRKRIRDKNGNPAI